MVQLDVVGENYISPDSVKHHLVMTEVENAAIDETGDWLATVERRDDGETNSIMKLKFWHYICESKGYEMTDISCRLIL